jgi:hypothetical protein
VSLTARFHRFRSLDDIGTAIELHRDACAGFAKDSYEFSAALNNLGIALQDRHDVTGRSTDLEEAVAAFRHSCRLGLRQGPEAALKAARSWGAWALRRQSWEEAAEAYSFGLEAMGGLFRIQASRGHKETWLKEARGLPSQAAYALDRADDFEGAALALEQGRALLLSEVLERGRVELEHLSEAEPDLVERFRRSADKLTVLERNAFGT